MGLPEQEYGGWDVGRIPEEILLEKSNPLIQIHPNPSEFLPFFPEIGNFPAARKVGNLHPLHELCVHIQKILGEILWEFTHTHTQRKENKKLIIIIKK